MFSFIVTDSTGEKREFERELFPVGLKDRLVDFIEAARVLNETSFARKLRDYTFSLHLANNGQITNTGNLPSDDELAAFLHRLRPFYLQKEALNFNSVCNAISAHLNDDAVTQCLRYYKRHNKGEMLQKTFKLVVAGKHINSPEFLDDYLNALEYHRAPERREVIEKISAHFPSEAQKLIVDLLLISRLSAINQLAHFVNTCFSRENGGALTLTSTEVTLEK